MRQCCKQMQNDLTSGTFMANNCFGILALLVECSYIHFLYMCMYFYCNVVSHTRGRG